MIGQLIDTITCIDGYETRKIASSHLTIDRNNFEQCSIGNVTYSIRDKQYMEVKYSALLELVLRCLIEIIPRPFSGRGSLGQFMGKKLAMVRLLIM